MKGKVKWFNVEKGYGFITKEDGTDVHVSARNIESGRTFPGFKEGDEVEFESKTFRKGPEALNVKLIEEDEKAE